MSGNFEHKRYIINLSAKKTEMQWQDTLDDFATEGVPLVFKWLGWAMLFGVLAEIQKTTGNTTLMGLLGLLAIAVIYYFTWLLSRVVVVWGEFPKEEERTFRGREKVVSFLLVIVLCGTVYFVATETMNAIEIFRSGVKEQGLPK